MAELLQVQGKLQDAQPLYEEALAGCRQVLGDRHPHTRMVNDSLARLMQAIPV